MKLTKIDDSKWYLKDMSRVVGVTHKHGDGWIVSGEDEAGEPFTTWAQTEKRAIHLLKKYTGYLK